ncbi:MAG TPA: hypothetical protein VFK30_14870 [Anaerolineae bacterium]|nr:hypothetical protein [Anaerolineae bacterium]
MACAALTGEVIRRFVGSMTRGAISQAGVIEVGRFPRASCMAGAALPGEVIGRLVGCVAGVALAGEMVGRFVGRVARGAISQAGVIEVGWLPSTGCVTGAALTGEVIGRLVGGVA